MPDKDNDIKQTPGTIAGIVAGVAVGSAVKALCDAFEGDIDTSKIAEIDIDELSRDISKKVSEAIAGVANVEKELENQDIPREIVGELGTSGVYGANAPDALFDDASVDLDVDKKHDEEVDFNEVARAVSSAEPIGIIEQMKKILSDTSHKNSEEVQIGEIKAEEAEAIPVAEMEIPSVSDEKLSTADTVMFIPVECEDKTSVTSDSGPIEVVAENVEEEAVESTEGNFENSSDNVDPNASNGNLPDIVEQPHIETDPVTGNEVEVIEDPALGNAKSFTDAFMTDDVEKGLAKKTVQDIVDAGSVRTWEALDPKKVFEEENGGVTYETFVEKMTGVSEGISTAEEKVFSSLNAMGTFNDRTTAEIPLVNAKQLEEKSEAEFEILKAEISSDAEKLASDIKSKVDEKSDNMENIVKEIQAKMESRKIEFGEDNKPVRSKKQ